MARKSDLRECEYIFGGPYRTYARADESRLDSFADGEIDHSSNPRVAALRDHRGKVTGYALVLTDNGLKGY